MTRMIVVLSLIVGTATPCRAAGTRATNLVVTSNSDCPSGQAVSEALWAIRPDSEWTALTATIEVIDDHLQVTLGDDARQRREIPVPPDCADRANRVALVIAVWSGALPAHATAAPQLMVAVPAPVLAPVKKSAMVRELGITGLYSTVGGWVPGACVELGWLRRDGWWGLRAWGAYQSAKSLRVDIGDSLYERMLVGAAMVLRWERSRLVLSSDWGMAGAYTRAHGDGYSQNQSASDLNVGLAADGRVGLRFGSYRVWADARFYRWLGKETVRVDPLLAGSPSTSVLPSWGADLGLGAGVVFD